MICTPREFYVWGALQNPDRFFIRKGTIGSIQNENDKRSENEQVADDRSATLFFTVKQP